MLGWPVTTTPRHTRCSLLPFPCSCPPLPQRRRPRLSSPTLSSGDRESHTDEEGKSWRRRQWGSAITATSTSRGRCRGGGSQRTRSFCATGADTNMSMTTCTGTYTSTSWRSSSLTRSSSRGFEISSNSVSSSHGVACLVYPGAVHTRFEHSLGVYSLAEEAVNRLHAYQGMELDIDHFDVQTVKIAGLLHDIGHGPFSHMFEHEFLPRVVNGGSKWSHEEMSLKLIDYVVDEHHIDIDPSCLKMVKEMVIAGSDIAVARSSKEKRFLYDIVANGRNGVDVDKFDYIGRDCRACGLGCNFQFQRLIESMKVIDDEICYPAKEYLTVNKLFSTRADLHRTVYTHAKIKALELMVVDAMVKANNYLPIADCIHDPAEYWKLDDTVLKTIETSTEPELKESRELALRIRRRQMYQFCNEYAVPKDRMLHFREITPQDIICSQKATGIMLKEEDIAVCNIKIDLSHGSNNPLERINFFKDYESREKFPICSDQISHLLPACYQDRIVRVYSKKPEMVAAVSEAFENLQLKMYGVKAQVHETPEKKKRRR